MSLYTPPTVPGGGATTYGYNNDHQLTSILRPDQQSITIGYDSAGRAKTVTTPTGITTTVYDPASGHVASVTAPSGGGTTNLQYDGSIVTGISQTGSVPGTIGYTYDRGADGKSSNFWITARTVNGDAATKVDYSYDNDGLVTRAGALQFIREASNGLLLGTQVQKTSDVIHRTSLGEVDRYAAGFDDGTCGAVTLPSAGCRVVLDQTFTRDNLGRISQRLED
ncbi:MAG: hypothetical protein ABIP42_05955, partial [Planctomycetota bacterium]